MKYVKKRKFKQARKDWVVQPVGLKLESGEDGSQNSSSGAKRLLCFRGGIGSEALRSSKATGSGISSWSEKGWIICDWFSYFLCNFENYPWFVVRRWPIA